MPYKWSENDSEGAGASEKMTPGVYQATVAKVVMGSKSKPQFKSKSGDVQIMVVFKNAIDQEASAMYTLSDKAAWTLVRLLSRCGVDLKKMEADGVEPKHFGNQKVAESYLLGRRVMIEVEQDGQYLKVTPYHEGELEDAMPSPSGGEDPFG